MILKNCTFINKDFEKEFSDIKIENGKITEIGITDCNGKDMSGLIILPGFIDIHIHGGDGADASDSSTEGLNKMSKYLAKRGITSFCPTTMTLSHPTLKNIVKSAKNIATDGAKIVGINLEGPYISAAKAGAQNREYIRKANIDELRELIKINDKIKLITVAPEECDEEFIRQASKMITVSIGHSNADEEQTRTAINNGILHATHLFNAMTAMTHREAGAVGAALDSSITCELICDTVHICPAVLRNAFRILGENRACVISDSMRGAGLGTGEFELGGQTVFVKKGYKAARLEDGTLAASITNVFEEFKNLLDIGIDFRTALKSCTINPARAIKEDKSIGSIEPGKYADFTVVDEELNLKEVYINGTLA